MEFCEIACVSDCLFSGYWWFKILLCKKFMYGPQQGLHLFCLVFYSQIHVYVPLKIYAIFTCQKYFLFVYKD